MHVELQILRKIISTVIQNKNKRLQLLAVY